MANKTKMVPQGHLRALIDESAVNNEDRTVTLTWSTGFKGLRNGYDGPYYEELSMDPNHLDMSRLQSGAPLLNSHDSQSLNSVIGVVERAWLEGDKGMATVRFASDSDSDKIFQKVKEKVLRNVSVGYQVRKYENVTQRGDEFATYRATDWMPHEISIVPIGFDPKAQVRSNELETEVEVIEQPLEEIVSEENSEMEKRENEAVAEVAAAPQVDVEALKEEAVQAERSRQNEIRLAVRTAKLSEEFADQLINNPKINADEARKAVFAKMAESKQEPTISNSIRIEVGQEDADKKRSAIADSLLCRIDSSFKPTEGARQYVGKSFLRSLEDLIPRKMGETDAMFAKRVMSSADLPLILANVAEKSIAQRYSLAPKTWSQWCKTDTLRNYKSHSHVKAGDFASLQERAEGAAYAEGTLGEERETVQIKDYGIIHAFTSQMMVNDDLGVLKTLTSQGGVAAARLVNKLAYSALKTNKIMNDGVALYDAAHGNLGTAGAISEATLGEALKLMRKQTTVDGLDTLNNTPKFLICGPDQEVAARKILTAIMPSQTSGVNIFQNSMELIVDAEITGNQYYFAGDSNLIDTVTVYFLEGQETPVVESRKKFETDDIEIKVSHTVAAAPMDFRGLVKNAGQA